ncbi:signal peptidase I [Halodesulfurarchaeum sp.]|uniref:signal peptidase I n=1 Tax=Halodesulfurarchaeum sp. TaxID=1980530 RepID=UPI001BB9AF5A|nr:signal peptidase I [Halodesulfurarchaeum sp.]
MNVPSRWRSIGAVVATVLLLAVIAPFAAYAVPQAIGADESYVVLSGSMEPTLSPGDVVVVDGSTAIEQGDIVTYASGPDAIPTTHRVVSVMGEGFETKGDANENADHGIVPHSSVLGEVTIILPLIGHVILWANTPLGFVSLIVLPVTALVLLELRSWSNSPGKGSTVTDTAAISGSSTATKDTFEFDGPVPADSASAIELETDDDAELSSEVTIDLLDLKLTVIAMMALFGYAGWNMLREIAAVSAPHPVTIGVLTAGLLGLGLSGWITFATWRTNRGEATAPPTAGPTRTDGSGSSEGTDD